MTKCPSVHVMQHAIRHVLCCLRFIKSVSVCAEVAELVQSALDGYHVCIMSYGQTGELLEGGLSIYPCACLKEAYSHVTCLKEAYKHVICLT
jgi:hypothetical protein